MSRCAWAAAAALLIFSSIAAGDSLSWDFDSLYSEMESCVSVGDLVSLRILASRAAHRNPDEEQWLRVRDLLHRNPSAGWDIIWKWDHLQLKDPLKAADSELNKEWTQADLLMAAGNFAKATPLYQKVLLQVREDLPKFTQTNFFAGQTLEHSLARSLYGEGRFKDSLAAYQGISLLYPFVRQIQFEKMWAAFRARDYSLALGAIAAQMSSYFSRYMEPETYLVQYYLYRQLCRKKEMAQVFASVKRFKKLLDKKGLKLEQWARFDLETTIQLRLMQSKYSGASDMISDADRDAEVQRIRAALERRYTADLARLKNELEKVVAYINMGSVAAKTELPAIPKSADLKAVLSSDLEMWPVEDAEDWLDEIGLHHFVGQSECK